MNIHNKKSEMKNIIRSSQSMSVPLECSSEFLEKWKNDFNSWPSIQYLGFNLDFIDDFASFVHIEHLSAIHRGGLGIDAVNGAIISGIMDGAIATIGFAHYPENICGTTNLSINIIRPVFGDFIFAHAYVIKKNKNMAFCESKLYDSDLKKCAIATGIISVSTNKRNKIY